MDRGPDSVTAVRAENLVKRYGPVAALNGFNLEIQAGQFFGLLGPNGSGKTTTIHILSTLIRANSGQATIAGFDVLKNPVDVRAAIGLVFQESALDRTLSVAENLRFAGLLYGMKQSAISMRAKELLALFDLADKLDRPVAALSGGMRRALDIIRGVIHHPRILFLDEPTIGLDLPNRRKIWRFIERLRMRTGMTVLLTTHYLEEADACDQVAFINSGRLIRQGTPAQLVSALGAHIVEIEGPDLTTLEPQLRTRLGLCLRDGDTATFCMESDNAGPLIELQSELGARISAMRWRRPNLNDVFLWVNAGTAPHDN
jgi:ABC-2 type transport system ATP-binding protein